MKFKLFIPLLVTIFCIPFAAKAIDQATIDQLIFLLRQPEGNFWSDGTFDDTTLYEGFTIIRQQAIDNEDDILHRKVLWAMGETGLAIFAPYLIESMEAEPIAVCYALGKIPSEAGVYVLIGVLEDEDMYIREAAAYSLGALPYTEAFEEAKEDAILALKSHLQIEEEEWVRETIDAAIVMIETGVATIEAYEEGESAT